MKLYNIEQGTDAWLKLREEHLTASDASAMMGASKYKSRTQLMKEKKFGVKEKITPAKQALFDKGHAAEDAARDLLEVDMLESFAPVVGGIEIDGLKLLASLDGLSEDQQMVFEHKLWNETLAENVRNNVLEDTHYWQLEHQLL
ncbi:YqaJ viral recombinase family protein, partial [Staphylococcus aureus]